MQFLKGARSPINPTNTYVEYQISVKGFWKTKPKSCSSYFSGGTSSIIFTYWFVRACPLSERPKYWGSPGHLLYALGSVVLIVNVTSHILQIMHVCPDQHVPQLYKVAVCLVFHCAKQQKQTTRTSKLHGWSRNWNPGAPNSLSTAPQSCCCTTALHVPTKTPK